ncbi:response regulator transcription factor [Kocuria sp.]|uniref:response regulator transcription factor n=1 Tax=Kocuria sp. TaxID=1871328 RepID=UPI0026DEDD00|nr:response regulator transcription factor [Kocuria sp.]MDO5618115.1 response regulator transcription factor [Kocuria sp.]
MPQLNNAESTHTASQGSSEPTQADSGQIRVLLVDDEALMRTGLRLILDGAENIRVVGEAGNGAEAAEQARALRPDVVLMDIRMPGTDGIHGCRAVREFPEAPQVLMLTAFDTDAFILEALEAGALGFLLKDTPPRQLVQAVQDAAQGTSSVSPSVLSRLIAVATAHGRRPGFDAGPPDSGEPLEGEVSGAAEVTTSSAAAGPNPLDALSEREREIADAVARGLTNTEIAEEMFLSITTVKTHVARIFTKLDVTNRVQVAIIVLEHGQR